MHYNDVIMSAIASQITSLAIVYSTVYSDTYQRKHQSSASLAFVWGIHREPVNSLHKGQITQKMLPFHGVIMELSRAERESNSVPPDWGNTASCQFSVWYVRFMSQTWIAFKLTYMPTLTQVVLFHDYVIRTDIHSTFNISFALCIIWGNIF